ncbi:Murein DD-endopeptidase MepM [compost metagenome]
MKTKITFGLIKRYWKPICVIAILLIAIPLYSLNALLNSAMTLVTAPFSYFFSSGDNATELQKEVLEEYKAIGLEYGIHWPDMVAYDTIRTKGDLESITKRSIKQTFEKFSYYEEVCTTVTDEEGNTKENCNQQLLFYSLEEVLTREGYGEKEINYALFISENLLSITNSDETNIPGGTVEIDPSLIANGDFLWPLPKVGRITSPFQQRINPVTGKPQFHKGIDISNGKSGVPVVATAEGTVIFWTDDSSSAAGKWIKIQHANNYQSRYLHLSRLAVSENSTHVKKGQVIGFTGSTGRSTGPHLHFEILKNGDAINPLPLIEMSRPK